MPADFSQADAAVTAAVNEVTETETLDTSVVAFIQALQSANAQAIADAVKADNDIDNSKIATLTEALNAVTARFVAARAPLAAAIVANTPSA